MCYEFEVYDVIGPEKLKKLQKECKTSRLYIPQTMHPNHAIARIIGLEAAILLSAEFPRCLFTISQSLVVRERNEMIIKEREAGAPPQFVATRFGLTARTVRSITQGLKIQRSRPRFGLRGRNLRKVLQHGGYDRAKDHAHG